MKEDYLWNKTGEDAEIEALENALQVFRYRETAPPALMPAATAKVLPFHKKEAPRRRSFQFALAAAAAGLLFGLIALGVLIQISNDRTQPNNLAQTIEPQTVNSEIPIAYTEEKTVDSAAEDVENVQTPKQSAGRKTILLRRKASTNIRQKQTKARNIKAIKPDTQLTKEEQYAFDQLMLALSITGSKLKQVRDKVEGTVEEKNVQFENGR
jgi:hypothetical protein